MTNLFTKRSLSKHRRVGDREGPITLLTPPLKATLGLGLLIAISGGIWSTLARIPVNVRGTGVLLPVSTISPSLSGTSGKAIWMFNKPTQPWHQEALNFKERPDQVEDQDIVLLAEKILLASIKSQRKSQFDSIVSAAASFTDKLKQTYKGKKVPSNKLLMWVQSSAQLEQISSALDQVKRRTLPDTKEQEQNIKAKQKILTEELESRSSYLGQMQRLVQKGFVSKASMLQQRAQVDNIRSQLYSNENELIRLNKERDSAYQRLRDELAKLINKELIYSTKEVYISQVVPNNGDNVQEGSVVMKLSDDSLDNASLVPVFLSSKEMAQVWPGMSALVTPIGFKRSEVGGIRAIVVSMAKLPSDRSDVINRVGVETLANVIINTEPSPTLAVIELQRSTNDSVLHSGGYLWSSRGDLPYPPTPGDRLDVEITTRSVPPITLVLPELRRFFGFSPAENKSGGNANSSNQSR